MTPVLRRRCAELLCLAGVVSLLTGCAPDPTGQSAPSPASTAPDSLSLDDSLAIIGDFGSGDDNERAVADLVARERPLAVLTVGDNVYSDAGYATLVGDYYGTFVKAEKFFPATGNHDYQQGIAAFDDYFGYLNGQREYTVTLGQIEFFILDGDQGLASLDANHNQQSWLRREVASSTADYQVVLVHYPPFSSGDSHGSTPDFQWDFAGMGVDLVIAAHDHIYERIVAGGVTYIVDGSGGKSLYGCGDPVAGSVVCDDSSFGALFLTAGSDALSGQYLTVAGGTVDAFTIPAKS